MKRYCHRKKINLFHKKSATPTVADFLFRLHHEKTNLLLIRNHGFSARKDVSCSQHVIDNMHEYQGKIIDSISAACRYRRQTRAISPRICPFLAHFEQLEQAQYQVDQSGCFSNTLGAEIIKGGECNIEIPRKTIRKVNWRSACSEIGVPKQALLGESCARHTGTLACPDYIVPKSPQGEPIES